MHLKDLGNLTNIINEGKQLGSMLLLSGNASDVLEKSFEGLNAAQILTKTSTMGLTEAQQLELIQMYATDKANYQNALSTAAISASQKTATASTLGLSTAFKGLWAMLMANPLILVGAGIMAGIAGFNAWKHSQDELAQATKSSAQEAQSASQSINDYAEKYKALHDELTNANTTEERQAEIKKELLSIQTDLNDKYGDEYGRINLVTDAYKDQTEVIKGLNKAMAEQWLADNNKGIDLASRKMEKINSYRLGMNVSMYSDSGKSVREIAEKYKSEGRGIDFIDDEGAGTYTIILNANAEDAEKTIDDFKKEIYNLKKQFKDDSLVDDVLNTSNDASDSVDKLLDKYQEIYNQAKMYQIADDSELSEGYNNATHAVEVYNDALASGDEDKIKETRADLENTKNSIDLTSEKWRSYANIINDVFDQADTRVVDFRSSLESQDGKNLIDGIKGYTETELKAMADDGNNNDAMDKLMESAKRYELSLEDVISTLKEMGVVIDETADKSSKLPKSFYKQEMISAINGMSEGFEALDKIMKTQSDKNPFDFSILDEKNFNDNFNIDALKDEYADFIEAISNSPKDVTACKDAYNNLVTAWINSKGILDQVDDSNAALTESMLTNMGVTNADILVQNALAGARAQAVWESQNLATATSSEIIALVNEEEATNNTGEAFGTYLVQKMLAEAAIDTNGDISALANVVASLGLATSAWQRYYAAKQRMAQISADPNYVGFEEDGSIVSKETVLAQYSKIAEDSLAEYAKELEGKAQKATYDGGPKTAKIGSGGGSSGSKQDKTFDWIQQKITYLRDEYSKYQEQIDDSNTSFRTQLNYLSEAQNLMSQIIDADKQAENAYLTNWQEVSASLSNELKDKIQHGDYSVDYFKDSEQATKAKEAWDKYYEQYKKTLEDEKTYQELQKSGLDKKNEWDKEDIERLKEKANIEQTNYEIQMAYLNQAVSKSENITKRLSDYADEANEKWEAAKETINSIDIAAIMRGELDLSQYENNSDYQKVLEEAIKAFEDKTDADKELEDAEIDLEERRKEAYEKAIEYVEAQTDYI